jgi:hypothetical protein
MAGVNDPCHGLGRAGAPEDLSDNETTPQIKVTVPAGTGTARRFVRLKVTSP